MEKANEPAAARSDTVVLLPLEIVSDVVCPWCFIGKRRMERAVGLLGPGVALQATWKPYRLNPSMPREGMERRAYRIAKFGTPEYAQLLDARVTAAAAAEGLAFVLDKITRTPNTLDAHRLIGLALAHGVQDAVVESLFNAYFVEGRDIGDRTVLAELAAAAGIPRNIAEAFVSGSDGKAEVIAEDEQARRLGISGVPTFLACGRVLFSGALDAQRMAESFRQVAPTFGRTSKPDARRGPAAAD